MSSKKYGGVLPPLPPPGPNTANYDVLPPFCIPEICRTLKFHQMKRRLFNAQKYKMYIKFFILAGFQWYFKLNYFHVIAITEARKGWQCPWNIMLLINCLLFRFFQAIKAARRYKNGARIAISMSWEGVQRARTGDDEKEKNKKGKAC